MFLCILCLAYFYLCVCQIPYLDNLVPPLREEARSYTCKLSNLRTTFASDKQEKDDAGKQRQWVYDDEEDADNIRMMKKIVRLVLMLMLIAMGLIMKPEELVDALARSFLYLYLYDNEI